MQSWRGRTHCSNLEHVIHLPILQEKRKSGTKMLFKGWKPQAVPWSSALEHTTISSGGRSRKQSEVVSKGSEPPWPRLGSHRDKHRVSSVCPQVCRDLMCPQCDRSEEWLTKRTDLGKVKERKRTTRTRWHCGCARGDAPGCIHQHQQSKEAGPVHYFKDLPSSGMEGNGHEMATDLFLSYPKCSSWMWDLPMCLDWKVLSP